MRSIVITGVSTGIGYGAAKVAVERGMRVFGSVRKPEDGVRLQAELGDLFVPLTFDVTDRASVDQAAAEVTHALKGYRLFGLINNAGIAVFGPLLHVPTDEMRRQFEVNLIGTMNVTQAFVPALGSAPARVGAPGKIINVSSMAGERGFPFVGPYATSKHALEGFSESLRRELILYGIDVIIAGMGAVQSAMWDKVEEDHASAYSETDFGVSMATFQEGFQAAGRAGMTAEQAGHALIDILESFRTKARYNIVPNRLRDVWLLRLMPRKLLDFALAKQLGFK